MCVCLTWEGTAESTLHRINIDTNQSKGPIDQCECNGSSAALHAKFDCTVDVNASL